MGFYRNKVNDIRVKHFPDIKGSVWILEVPFFVVGGMVLFLF